MITPELKEATADLLHEMHQAFSNTPSSFDLSDRVVVIIAAKLEAVVRAATHAK